MESQYSLKVRKANKMPGRVREGTESETAKSRSVVLLHKSMVHTHPEEILERHSRMEEFKEDD